MQKTLKSYFFWTHQRGSFHYDVMVTLILAFIFVTPHLWNYGDKPAMSSRLAGPIQVSGSSDNYLVITVPAANVVVDPSMDTSAVRKALHQAIEPVTGDAVAVVKWDTVSDAAGKPVSWRVTAHR
jgi:hypothetical protein